MNYKYNSLYILIKFKFKRKHLKEEEESHFKVKDNLYFWLSNNFFYHNIYYLLLLYIKGVFNYNYIINISPFIRSIKFMSKFQIL
jgi:hypothetical protein